MIKQYRLPGNQRYAKHTEANPYNVQDAGLRIQWDGVVSIESHVVENNDETDDLATQGDTVGNHEESISFLDWAADGLVTTTKLLEVAAELSSIADTFAELAV